MHQYQRFETNSRHQNFINVRYALDTWMRMTLHGVHYWMHQSAEDARMTFIMALSGGTKDLLQNSTTMLIRLSGLKKLPAGPFSSSSFSI